MRTHIIKNRMYVPKEFMMSFGHGWGNGYVLLDSTHPWYNWNYEDIPVVIHGGLTFGEIIDKRAIEEWDTTLTENDIGKYMIGFDTCHGGDTATKWTKEAVQAEADKLMYQCLKVLNNKTHGNNR